MTPTTTFFMISIPLFLIGFWLFEILQELKAIHRSRRP